MVKKADIYVQEFMDVLEKRKKEHENVRDAFIDTVTIICQRLILEVKEIMVMRKATSDIAFEAVIKEQNRKWKAIVRRLDFVQVGTSPRATATPSLDAFQIVWDTFKVGMMKNG